MGTDIHAVIEYEESGSYWALGTANLPRNHAVFSAIAFGDGGITDDLPFPPRGLPQDLSSDALDLFVDPDGDPDVDYSSQLRADFHTPGWLTFGELHQALTHQGIDVAKLAPAYHAVLASMEVMVRHHGGDRVRLVFCFDG